MSLTIPYTFTPKTKAKANEVNANFQAVANKFTEGPSGIVDADVSTGADLNANKLSSSAGKRIVEAKFEDDAVDGRVLKDDNVAGSANAAVNLLNHIKDRLITKVKLSNVAGSKISLAELDITISSFAINAAVSTDSQGLPSLSDIAGVSLFRSSSGGNWVVRVRGMFYDFPAARVKVYAQDINTALPTASKTILSMYSEVTTMGVTFTGTLYVVHIPNT